MGEYFLTHFNYWVVVLLMMVGLYIVFASGNMVKRLIGLGVFQTSVFLFYITLGKVAGGVPPILPMTHGGHGDDHGEPHGPQIPTGYTLPDEPVADGEPEAHADAPSHDGAQSADHGADHGAEHGGDHAGALHGDGGHAGELADVLYSNPLPHVLILTAIVVGVATLAVGLALVVRIREVYGTIEDEDIDRAEFGETGSEA